MSTGLDQRQELEDVLKQDEGEKEQPEEQAGAPPEGQETPPEGEEDASSETPPEDAEPESPPEAAEPPEWVTDDVRSLARNYGLDDEELAGFSSGADFYRAARLLDRTLTGRKPAEEGETPEEAGEAKEEPAPEKSETEKAQEAEDDLTLDLAKYAEYDEDTQRVVKVARRLQEENKAFRDQLSGMSEQVRKEFDQIHQERAELLHEMEIGRFHDVMDGLDESLYGGNGKLDEETDTRRQEVWEAYRQLAQLDHGERRPPIDVLVRRAVNMAHGDELLKAQKDRIYGEIQSQGRGRRPAPSRNKVVPDQATEQEPMTLPELAKQIANDPDVASRFDKYEQDEG